MTSAADRAPLQVAVVTGNHPFDVPSFHRLFCEMPGIDAYVQDLENWVHDWGQVRRNYDAVVFYHFHQETPQGAFAEAVEELGASGIGVVVLHHALLAWPQWPEWSALCGIEDRSFGYHMGQQVRVEVADPDHAVTQGLTAWEMGDETYTMADAGEGNQVLLTIEHPLSMRTAAWTRTHKEARVFCLQSGHDQAAWGAPGFKTVLHRGILWAAGRI